MTGCLSLFTTEPDVCGRADRRSHTSKMKGAGTLYSGNPFGIPGLWLKIYDDYYSNFEEVRDFALSCTFSKPYSGAWSGLHSEERHPETRENYYTLAERIPEKGVPEWDNVEKSFVFWGRPSAGLFATLYAGEQDTVHFHRRSGTWAGVCYLNEDQAGNGGLHLFRHLETGLYSCKGAGLEDISQLRADGPDSTKWEKVASVAMKPNRMIVFDGRFFHAASDGFGDQPGNCRLTQLFNIDFKESAEAE